MSNANPRSLSRSTARLAAVQALYQKQMEGTKLAKLLDEFHQHRLGEALSEDAEGAEFAEAEADFFDDIVTGTLARQEEIDPLLETRLAQGWSLTRLDKAMLQILRAGTYELLARADIPAKAVINEYVDVAHAFFDEREAKFVNGILDKLAKEVR